MVQRLYTYLPGNHERSLNFGAVVARCLLFNFLEDYPAKDIFGRTFTLSNGETSGGDKKEGRRSYNFLIHKKESNRFLPT
jgi:hypothetical protein